MSLFDDASLVLTPNGYKASKLYSIKPTSGLGDMTVVRATTARRVNSAGLIESVATNVPRLDYPPLGGCPSILVEPLRTNLVLRSEEFDNIYWLKVGSTITANSATAPDGTLTADKIIEDTSNGLHSAARLGAMASAGTYTLSIFAKAAERTRIAIGNASAGHYAIFDLSTGTVVQGSQGTVTNGKISSQYANGYYLVSCTITVVSLSSISVNLVSTGTTTSYLGNGTSGLFIWGAQLEAGSNATSYIPTVAATVTRNADVISKTGVSSLIGQTEGTLYAEINNTLMTYAAQGYLIRIFADANNEVFIRKESTTSGYTARWRANGTNVYTQFSIPVLNGNNKIAIAYKTGSSAVYLNGTQIGTSASTGAFSVAPSIIAIGSTSTIDFFNDRIELATLFPTRLTNAQLATLTTL